ncbi:MAG: hypothetical protein CM1200mP13_14540 [Candidatus Pelagibacterales bacterium]|nr:MAG: hypothetical protein CM1200mP13_14540 [Pelagibacterales bacterium]
MGIGDMIIFLPFIEAISKKYNTPISILVKQSTKALEILKKIPILIILYFLIEMIAQKKVGILVLSAP